MVVAGGWDMAPFEVYSVSNRTIRHNRSCLWFAFFVRYGGVGGRQRGERITSSTIRDAREHNPMINSLGLSRVFPGVLIVSGMW